MKEELDFVAIGDTVVDAFIKLKDAHVSCRVDNTECELCMPFGAKVPYDSVTVIPAVGNAANAAVSASRLGLKTGLVTFLGNDINGRECKFQLEQENISTEYVTMETGKTTNYHYVLWFGDERTILIKHETFKTFLPPISKPKWIYLTSLGEHARDLHFELAHYLSFNPEVKLVFQPGTFQIKMGTEALAPLYKRSYLFCCNVEEAQLILNTKVKDINTLLLGISLLGPKIVCITDGKNGSYMRTDDENYFLGTYPDPLPPLERTGAGDAFTSTFASAIALGLSPVEAIRWAPINSMNVVQYIGAQKGLLKKKDLLNLLDTAPSDYVVKKF